LKTIARKDWTEGYVSDVIAHRNDIYLVDGQFAFVSGYDAKAQTLESVIKTVQGEMQLDNELGAPYFTTVFQDNFHLEMWATAIREMVVGLAFVDSISEFKYEYDFSNRKLTFSLTVVTNDGEEITVEEEDV